MAENNDLQFIDCLPVNDLVVLEGESLHLEMAFFSVLPSGELKIRVKKGASLEAALADFSIGSSKLNVEIALEEGATSEFHLAALGKGDSVKTYIPNAIHLEPHSESLISSYGIASEKSNISFLGTSSIEKNAKNSATRQEAKVILFDKESKGAASPILKIADNDVKASHGASVGRLNDDHLFYLESRGLSEEDAKRLITLGYLKPIASYFADESLRQRIESEIEGGIYRV